ncbi:hypothetical protein, partial [uncultured Duncaniella sp.]|uniref:hypothetical protein n=2 Tax=uncultured Duncaniella sp. TaxID=2768039 RepID=UPI0025A9D320
LCISAIQLCLLKNYRTVVRVQNGTILILNKAADSIVRVFTLHGVLLKETKEQEISDINRGIYIVMVGNHSFKVVI